MEKKWTIIFSNGYCGCDIEEEFIGTYDEAVDFANDYLPDYAEQYAHAALGWNKEPDPDEYEQYAENCGYNIEEREEEDDDEIYQKIYLV